MQDAVTELLPEPAQRDLNLAPFFGVDPFQCPWKILAKFNVERGKSTFAKAPAG